MLHALDAFTAGRVCDSDSASEDSRTYAERVEDELLEDEGADLVTGPGDVFDGNGDDCFGADADAGG